METGKEKFGTRAEVIRHVNNLIKKVQYLNNAITLFDRVDEHTYYQLGADYIGTLLHSERANLLEKISASRGDKVSLPSGNVPN
jgi:hypothetical protein